MLQAPQREGHDTSSLPGRQSPAAESRQRSPLLESRSRALSHSQRKMCQWVLDPHKGARDSLKGSTEIVREEQDWCTEEVRGRGQDWDRRKQTNMSLPYSCCLYHDMLRENGQEVVEEYRWNE